MTPPVSLERASGNSASDRRPPEGTPILLVDDRPDELLVLESVLQAPAFRLVSASSGREAVEAAGREEYAAILLDVKVPGLDGFETALQIRAREHPRRTPILFMTGQDLSEEESERASQVGAIDYLVKPFRPELLSSKMHALAELYAAKQGLEAEVRVRTEELLRREALQRFCAEASQVLSTSLDPEETLTNLCRLAVPRMGDWAMVYLKDRDSRLVRTCLVHADPAKQELAREYHRTFPEAPKGSFGAAHVVETGESELLSDLTKGLPVPPGAMPEERVRMIHELGAQSSLVVPIRSPGQILGALILISADPGRNYGDVERTMAEDLGRRAGVALENARLHRSAQEATRRYRELVEGLDAIVWEADAETWQFTYVSPRAEKMLGYPMERWLTEKDFWPKIIHPDDRAEALRSCIEATKACRDNDFEYRALTLDGRELWIRDLVYTTPGPDGRAKYLRGIMFDVTERRKAVEALRRSEERERARAGELERHVAERTDELRSALRELESFSYSVAHDLRAPLRAMVGFTRLLTEECEPAKTPAAAELVDRIESAGRHMDDMIRDLLDYSRAARSPIALEPVPLAEPVEEALFELGAVIKEKGAQVAVAPGLPQVLAHRESLARAITNLVSNALKFVSPGTAPRVRIGAEDRGERVRLWIEDNGIGIAPEHQDRIFGLFERLHGRETYPGTGIGLAIVRKTIERMGGRVGLESEPGKGSRFWLDLRKRPLPE